MKTIIIILALSSWSLFAATTIRNDEGKTNITRLKKLSDSSLNWFFNWGENTDPSKSETCNSYDNNVELCNTNAEKGFRVDKDTVCKVYLEKLNDLEVATVDCLSGDRAFQLNNYACFTTPGSSNLSQTFTFSHGKNTLGMFGISCSKKPTIKK